MVKISGPAVFGRPLDPRRLDVVALQHAGHDGTLACYIDGQPVGTLAGRRQTYT